MGGYLLKGDFDECVAVEKIEGGIASADLPSSSQVWILAVDASEDDALGIANCLNTNADSGQVTICYPKSEG